MLRRRAASLVVVVACLISGCSPSSPVSNDVSPSESGESPQALSEESWPTFGRQEMDSVDVDVERTLMLETALPDYSADVFGEGVSAVWVTDNPDAVEIKSDLGLGGESVSWNYTTQDDDLQTTKVEFASPTVAYVVESPPIEQMTLEGPGSRVMRLALDTKGVDEVQAPTGMHWNPWSARLTTGPSGTYAVARSTPESRDCLVRINDLDVEVVECLDQQQISFTKFSPDGMGALTFPWGENIIDCRKLWNIPLDGGEPSQVGPEDECLRYDGVMLDGWEIWTQINPKMPEALPLSALLADGPDGQKLTFGFAASGSLEVCGEYLYWQKPTHMERDAEGSHQTLRWKPGMEHTEIVWQDKEGDVEGYPYTGPPNCVDGIVNMVEEDMEAGSTDSLIQRLYTLSVNAQS